MHAVCGERATRWCGRSEKAELESQQGETVEGLSHQAKEPRLFCEQKGARKISKARRGLGWARWNQYGSPMRDGWEDMATEQRRGSRPLL